MADTIIETTKGLKAKDIFDKVRVLMRDCELTDADLTVALDQALKDLVLGYDFNFMEKEFVGHAPSGVNNLELPEDYARGTQLLILDPTADSGRDISRMYMRREEFYKCNPFPDCKKMGAPCYWTIKGGELIFDKPLDTEYILRLCYIACPPDVEDGTTALGIPSKFCNVITDATLAKMHIMNDDYDKATQIEARLDSEVIRMGRDDSFTQMMDDDIIPSVWGRHG